MPAQLAALPFDVAIETLSDQADVSLLPFDLRGVRLPALPLERSGGGAVAGQSVVVVGFPAGLEALLAKADAEVVRAVLESAGSSVPPSRRATSQR